MKVIVWASSGYTSGFVKYRELDEIILRSFAAVTFYAVHQWDYSHLEAHSHFLLFSLLKKKEVSFCDKTFMKPWLCSVWWISLSPSILVLYFSPLWIPGRWHQLNPIILSYLGLIFLHGVKSSEQLHRHCVILLFQEDFILTSKNWNNSTI